jgi:hypothetical protein
MRARIKRRQRIRRLTILVTIAVIAVSLVVAFYFALNNKSPYSSLVGKPVSGTIIGQLKGVSDSTLSAIGQQTNINAPTSISGSPLNSGGKPLVLYVGGDYCPFCAFERWSLTLALSRFGEFSNLEYMLSSATDTHPNSPTFTFANSTYTSNYIAFTGVEEFGQDPNTVVRPLTSSQQALVSGYDTCAATQGNGGIPFVDIANKYAINCGAQSSLDISGMNWTQIASQLNTPTSTVAQAIDGAANTLITAICNVDGHAPGSVCGQSYATVPLSFTPNAGVFSEQALYVSPEQRQAVGTDE